MKKLLALVLVLGVASIANATLVFNGGDEIVGISNIAPATVLPVNPYIALVSNDVVFSDNSSDVVWNPDALANFIPAVISNGIFATQSTGAADYVTGFTNAIVLDFTDGSSGTVAGTTPMTLGKLVNVTVTGTGTVKFYSLDSEGAVVGQVGPTDGVVITPEPITMTLLGLGSLVALRRRR